MTISRREKPKYRAAAIAALLGFSFIALGYTYLQVWPGTRTIIGGMFLASGLLATGLALVLAFFAKPKSSRPDIKTLRGEYERSYSDKRAIDFDEIGWRLFWYEGEDVSIFITGVVTSRLTFFATPRRPSACTGCYLPIGTALRRLLGYWPWSQFSSFFANAYITFESTFLRTGPKEHKT